MQSFVKHVLSTEERVKERGGEKRERFYDTLLDSNIRCAAMETAVSIFGRNATCHGFDDFYYIRPPLLLALLAADPPLSYL